LFARFQQDPLRARPIDRSRIDHAVIRIERHNASDAKLTKHVKHGGESITLWRGDANQEIRARARDALDSIDTR
jgi:hypothetical protein